MAYFPRFESYGSSILIAVAVGRMYATCRISLSIGTLGDQPISSTTISPSIYLKVQLDLNFYFSREEQANWPFYRCSYCNMAPPRVVIIGCGVAGPVIALLLKKKGYDSIVLEKVRKLGDAGASLMLMPNGYVGFPIN